MTYTPNGGLPDEDYYSNVVNRTFNWVDHETPVDGQTLTLPTFDFGSSYYEDVPCQGKLVTVTVPDSGCDHGNNFSFMWTDDDWVTDTV